MVSCVRSPPQGDEDLSRCCWGGVPAGRLVAAVIDYRGFGPINLGVALTAYKISE